MLPWVILLSIRNDISIDSAVFTQLMAQSLYTLQWAAHFTLQIVSLHEGSDPSNTWFLGSTRVHNLNDIWIGSAIFAGLTTVTNRQTDHAAWAVTTGCI